MESSGIWGNLCQKEGLTVEQHNENDGAESYKQMDIPTWAFASVPENRTFNVESAVLGAWSMVLFSSNRLTLPTEAAGQSTRTLIIILPIVSGLGVLVTCVVAFFVYRRWKSRQAGAPRRRKNLFESIRKGIWAPKIRKGTRPRSWVIDGRSDSEEFGLASTPQSSTTTGATYGGEHVPLSSSPPPMEPGSSMFSTRKPKVETYLPGKTIWRDSELAHRVRRGWLLLRIPFKDTPVPVNSTRPSRSFDIDGSNKSTRTNSTLENYRRGGFRANPLSPSTEAGTWDYTHNTIPEVEDEDDTDSDLGLGDRPDRFEDENESLISTRDRQRQTDVLIISRSNNHASLESSQTASSTKVVPPSPVRSSPGPPPSPVSTFS